MGVEKALSHGWHRGYEPPPRSPQGTTSHHPSQCQPSCPVCSPKKDIMPTLQSISPEEWTEGVGKLISFGFSLLRPCLAASSPNTHMSQLLRPSALVQLNYSFYVF